MGKVGPEHETITQGHTNCLDVLVALFRATRGDGYVDGVDVEDIWLTKWSMKK